MTQIQKPANIEGAAVIHAEFGRSNGPSSRFAPDHAALLDEVARVGEQVKARAREIDAARAFPAELYDELHQLGAFYALAPRRYGGVEAPLAVYNELIYRSARANGSMGWLMMVGAAQGVGHGFLTRTVYDKIAQERPRPNTRSAIAPKGRAIPVEGGYMVSGVWPFASGGPNPDFITGNCIVFRDGKPSLTPEGMPEAIIAILPADKAQMLDTWYVMGMKGTDSCDIKFDEVFVPADHANNIFTAKNFFDLSIGSLPLRVILSMGHVSVALGIAQGAMDDIVELSRTKSASMNPNQKLRDDPIFRHALGENHLRLKSLKAMLDQVTQNAQAAADEGRPLDDEETLSGRTMSAFVTFECCKIVDWAYTAGGSSSVYEDSSLQRRFRDIHVATQHAACHHAEPYQILGKALMGDKLTPAELF